jgi:outer membrane lipoprotein SlyB
MKKHLLSATLAAGLLLGASGQAYAKNYQPTRHHYIQRSAYARHQRYLRHKRHKDTVKRVGIGAAGGAAIGALAGGGKGAGIGAIAGAGAGALYDAHRKDKGR